MTEYQLQGIGTANVGKYLECDFSVSAEEFFSRFFNQTYVLRPKTKKILRAAINSGKRQKVKQARGELEAFFNVLVSE